MHFGRRGACGAIHCADTSAHRINATIYNRIPYYSHGETRNRALGCRNGMWFAPSKLAARTHVGRPQAPDDCTHALSLQDIADQLGHLSSSEPSASLIAGIGTISPEELSAVRLRKRERAP
jgi:hypothetical protein